MSLAALLRVAAPILLVACAGAEPPAAEAYRLSHSGTHWDRRGEDPVFESVRDRYPAFFTVILDPVDTREPDLRPLRNDLEHQPVDRRNYDALNALAIAYFELNYRASADRGGRTYLADSFRSSKLLALPWRAYGEIEDPGLRDAILAFFEDAGSGEKLGTATTAPRLAAIVASLEKKEPDPGRRARIRALTARLRALDPQATR